MNNEQLMSEMLEILKKHAKKPEDITTEAEKAAAVYFTEDKFDEMATELIRIMEQYRR